MKGRARKETSRRNTTHPLKADIKKRGNRGNRPKGKENAVSPWESEPALPPFAVSFPLSPRMMQRRLRGFLLRPPNPSSVSGAASWPEFLPTRTRRPSSRRFLPSVAGARERGFPPLPANERSGYRPRGRKLRHRIYVAVRISNGTAARTLVGATRAMLII